MTESHKTSGKELLQPNEDELVEVRQILRAARKRLNDSIYGFLALRYEMALIQVPEGLLLEGNIEIDAIDADTIPLAVSAGSDSSLPRTAESA